jgi:mannose-6-phosphate isomerase-like protein (cupin superfamily)
MKTTSPTRRHFIQAGGLAAITAAISGDAFAAEASDAAPPTTGPASLKPTIVHTHELMEKEPKKNLWTLHQSATSRSNLVRMHGPGVRHFHPDAEHSLYVISGTVKATVADEKFTLTAGDYINIPAGVPHGYDATGPEPALLVSMDAPAYDPAKTVRLGKP